MNRSSLDFLLGVLAGPRRVFYYSKDEYARYLLERQTQDGVKKLTTVQNSRWGRLLDRPLIKSARSDWGDGKIDQERLRLLQSDQPLAFRLTFGKWGSERHHCSNYDQTSRPGYNLVLQLNFAGDHNRQYEKLISADNYHPFRYSGHPTRAGEDYTLAWARIDLSDNMEEALIEEIQTDWWKEAKADVIENRHRKRDANGKWREWTTKRSRNQLEVEKCEQYLTEVLNDYGNVWAEAMLTATLQFLWEEIGVSRIFYHTYETGCVLKNCKPPKSLYKQLPKRFCFQQTDVKPVFLEKRLRKLKRKIKTTTPFWLL